MPQYLRHDAVRLLEASQESLSLAMSGLGLPVRHALRQEEALRAPVMGLIGTASELSMSACLVHVYGQEALSRAANGKFKTGREILQEFRHLLRNPVPRAQFLVAGIEDPDAHRAELLEQSNAMSVLIAGRAAGLHTGRAPSREVCMASVSKATRFLQTLGMSTRIGDR